ncbi:helix-turn-helix domain-containing protein [bacterium]|nr:helix-turn-helix domain-containing protein [bacterium]
MANQLKMAMKQAILALAQRGWSHRRIAQELDVHRETVARYVRLAGDEAKPAKVTLGADATEGPKPAKVTAGTEAAVGSKPAKVPPGNPAAQSRCEPFREVIQKKLDLGLSAQRIYQDLVVEQGLTASYCSVKRFVRRLGKDSTLPFRRMECEPGHEAQVDFGSL